jgi:hypothetical protein
LLPRWPNWPTNTTSVSSQARDGSVARPRRCGRWSLRTIRLPACRERAAGRRGRAVHRRGATQRVRQPGPALRVAPVSGADLRPDRHAPLGLDAVLGEIIAVRDEGDGECFDRDRRIDSFCIGYGSPPVTRHSRIPLRSVDRSRGAQPWANLYERRNHLAHHRLPDVNDERGRRVTWLSTEQLRTEVQHVPRTTGRGKRRRLNTTGEYLPTPGMAWVLRQTLSLRDLCDASPWRATRTNLAVNVCMHGIERSCPRGRWQDPAHLRCDNGAELSCAALAAGPANASDCRSSTRRALARRLHRVLQRWSPQRMPQRQRRWPRPGRDQRLRQCTTLTNHGQLHGAAASSEIRFHQFADADHKPP